MMKFTSVAVCAAVLVTENAFGGDALTLKPRRRRWRVVHKYQFVPGEEAAKRILERLEREPLDDFLTMTDNYEGETDFRIEKGDELIGAGWPVDDYI